MLHVTARASALAASADRIRHHALDMGEVQGQGYVGQALGLADVLAVVYKDVARLRPEDPGWEGRDRVLLSMGHYAIALYAALAEAGILDVAELETYGSDDSRLPMSGMSTYTPGMEISGGSLGHGLGLAVGMALGLRHQHQDARVINLMSDGELDEGSTWEAAMAASHHQLGRLLCVVDMNGLQADGPTQGVLRLEPVEAKWAAFGWRTVRCDGNDIPALLEAFDSVPPEDERPAVVVCDTRIARGVPFLETREKAHFLHVEDHEWELAHEALRHATTHEGN
jgi:transketolase